MNIYTSTVWLRYPIKKSKQFFIGYYEPVNANKTQLNRMSFVYGIMIKGSNHFQCSQAVPPPLISTQFELKLTGDLHQQLKKSSNLQPNFTLFFLIKSCSITYIFAHEDALMRAI